MELPINPVVAATRRLNQLARLKRPPDWALLLVAAYPPERAATWTPAERERWRRAWSLLKP